MYQCRISFKCFCPGLSRRHI